MRSAVLLLAAVGTGSCAFLSLNESVSGADATTIGTCLTIHLYALPDDEKRATVESMEYLCGVFQHPLFHKRLAAQQGSWIAGPPDGGTLEWVGGAELLSQVVNNRFEDVHIFSAFLFMSSGEAGRTPNRLAFQRGRISHWSSVQPSSRASAGYLNTLAHELSHLAVDKNEDTAFSDEGAETFCTRAHLAAYRFGDLVECHVRYSGEDEETDFQACLRWLGLGDATERCASTTDEQREACVDDLWKEVATCRQSELKGA